MLMSDSIGGTAKTLMFVNVSPVDANLDETQNSLQARAAAAGGSGCGSWLSAVPRFAVVGRHPLW